VRLGGYGGVSPPMRERREAAVNVLHAPVVQLLPTCPRVRRGGFETSLRASTGS